ncbi:alpha,alpha-trehalase [Nematocida minor]|uniref:alpha,alpha-trehalase n=1 Tax=Nematocida minor TaxID=1912983 RepID=UPI00221EB2D9|nr:alpha,alpha-trehalase [Nematocida minor]KAI5190557.1 alpha,alpha-trehalase [Nematocida minor]
MLYKARIWTVAILWIGSVFDSVLCSAESTSVEHTLEHSLSSKKKDSLYRDSRESRDKDRRDTRLYTKAYAMEEYPNLYKQKTTREIWEMFVDLLWFTEKKDQKSIVDSRSNISVEELVEKYKKIKNNASSKETLKTRVVQFYDKYFIKETHEKYSDDASEDKENENSGESKYARMERGIRSIWKKLIKDITAEDNGTLQSTITQNNKVVVPGGRFQEAYYWDFYWMAKGLHISGRTEEIEGMKKNFQDLIDKSFGFIPNGTRWYYSNRSQPPYFMQILVDSMEAMQRLKESVKEQMEKYKRDSIEESENKKIKDEIEQPLTASHVSETANEITAQLEKAELESAEKEFEFWDTKRTVTVEVTDGPQKGTKHRLSRYSSETKQPRGEMLLEDLKAHENYITFYNKEEEDSEYYRHIVSSTESGWDFSKRWRRFDDKIKKYGFLQTNNIIPVDLNSILVKNARILSKCFENTGDKDKAEHYKNLADERARAIDAILWDKESKRWRDVIISKKEEKGSNSSSEALYTFARKKDKAFYHSDLHPLYMDIASDPENKILEAHKNMMWLSRDGITLPCTSSNIAGTAAENNPLQQDTSTKTEVDLFQKEHEKKDQWDGHNI